MAQDDTENETKPYKLIAEYQNGDGMSFYLVEVDSCQYIVITGGGKAITHHGNCPNTKHKASPVFVSASDSTKIKEWGW